MAVTFGFVKKVPTSLKGVDFTSGDNLFENRLLISDSFSIKLKNLPTNKDFIREKSVYRASLKVDFFTADYCC